MRVKFNKSHRDGELRDLILDLNARFNKVGETEFEADQLGFSGRQLLALAKEGVELGNGVISFLKTTVDFLDLPYDEERLMRDYLSQHMNHVFEDGTLLVLLANPEHLDDKGILEFSQYGQILSMEERDRLIEGVELGILDIDREWSKYYNDYKQAREAIKQVVITKEVTGLSSGELKVAAKWFTVGQDVIDSVLSLDEQLIAGDRFDANSRASREKRYTKVFNYFRATLSTADALKVAGVINQHNLKAYYIELGFEGDGAVNFKGETDQPAILDFLKGNAPFDTTGVPSLGLVPKHGLTVQQLIDKGVDIIKNGNY